MANNDLRISLTGTLNVNSTISQINGALKNIENQLKTVKINVQIDQKAQTALNNLNTQVRNVGSGNNTKGVQNLNTHLTNVTNSAKKTTTSAISLGDAFSQAFQKFPIWLITGEIFIGSIRAVTKLVDTLYVLDERLISIRKVLEDANMTTVFENATKAAYEYGRTIDGALESLGEISKLGFGQQDAEILNRNAMLLSTVGEFKNDAEAAQYLIGIMRQYKFTVAETADVVSSLNEVSNKTGATTVSLSQGLSKSSSVAAMAGVSFNDLNGMLSSTIETLKIGGNEAGNFYKTLFTRFLRGSTQNAIINAGVQVKDLNGELRSATDVLQDLGQRWSSYSKEQRNSLVQSLGGVYHVNKVSALLEHQADVYKNAQYSANSYNSAQKELATFQEGLRFKTNNMIAAFQELSMTIGQVGARDGMVGLIEGITSLVQGFTALTEATDGWNIKLPLLALGIFGAVKAFNALKVAMISANASFGLIGAGVVVAQLLASAFMNSSKMVQGNTEVLLENAQKTAEQTNSLEQLIAKHNELESQVDGSTGKQKELQSVLKQIKDLAPHLIDSTGKYGNALELNEEKTKNYIASLKQMTKEQVRQAEIANSIEISYVNIDLEKAKKKLKSIENATKESFEVVKSYQDKYNVEALDDAEKEYDKRSRLIQSKMNATTDPTKKSRLSIDLDNAREEFAEYLKVMEKSRKDLKGYSEQLTEVNELEGKKESIEERKKAIDELTNSVSSNTSATFKQSKALSEVKDGNFEATEGMEGLSDATSSVTDSTTGLVDSLGGEVTGLKNSTSATLDNISALQLLYGVTSDQIDQANNALTVMAALAGQTNLTAEQQQLLAQATGILSEMYPQLNGKISENIGWISSQVGMMSSLNDVSGKNAYTMITNQNETTKKTVSQINERIKGYQTELDALSALSAGIAANAETEGLSAGKMQMYQNAQKKIAGIKLKLAEAKSDSINAVYNSGVSTGQIKSTTPSTGGGSNSKSTGTTNTKEDKLSKLIDSTIKSFDTEQDKLDDRIKKSTLLQERYTEGSAKWIAEAKNQIALTKDKSLSVASEIAAIQNLLKTEKLSKDQKTELKGKIRDLKNEQLEYANTVIDINKKIKASEKEVLDSSIEKNAKLRESKIESQIKLTEKLYDTQISSLKDKLALLEKEEQALDRIRQLNDIQAQMDKVESDKRFVYVDKDGKEQLTYDKGAYADLQKQKAEMELQFQKEDAKAEIEALITEAEVNRDKSIEKLNKLQEDYLAKTFKNTAELTTAMKTFATELTTLIKSINTSAATTTTKASKIVLPKKKHTGGIVGSGGTSRLGELINRAFNVNPNEEVITALKREVVINPDLPSVKNNIRSLLSNFTPNTAVANGGNVTNYNMSGFTIKADNAMEMFKNLDMYIRMNN